MLDGRQVVYGGEPVDVRVRCRPGLRWSRATHKHFPGAFRAATRALLLAHARQRERLQPGSSAPAAAPAAAGCPADEDVHMDCSENLLSSSCAVAEPKKVFNFDAAAGVNASAAAAAATVSAASPAAPSCTPAQLQQQAEQAGLYILHEQRHGLLRRVLSTLLPHLNPDAIHFMDIDHQHGYLAAHHQRAAAMRAAAAALPPAAAVGRAAASTAVAARAPLLHIGLLPLDLVVHIVSLMAPTDVRQDISLRPDGHPDILPALLPGDPVEMAAAAAATLAAMEAENAAAMETDHT